MASRCRPSHCSLLLVALAKSVVLGVQQRVGVCGYPDCSLGVVTDASLPCHAQPIALEVDGPYHFTCNTLQPLGHTILRYVA